MTGRRVAIVGAALSDCGRVDDKTDYELHLQATRRALDDAGLSRDDIGGFMSTGIGPNPPIAAADYMGFKPDWADSTTVGGSTWEFMVEHAYAAIAMGLVDVVAITYGSTTRADLKRKRRTANLTFGGRGPEQFDAPFGHTLISRYAMAARRHMHEFGTTIDQLAEIAVSTRYNAQFNPDALYRDPITLADVADSRLMADPFTKLHCCVRSDGGGCVILASEDRARDCAKAPVWVLGTGEAISHVTMSEWEDFTESPCVRSGRQAFARAGVTPADIDVCQLYDSFTITVLMTLEGLGFCPKGDGGAFVADGKLRVGGALPTNTDGGGLSACHPGMRGIFLLVEAARQLRGECGPRQVPDAALACVNGTGGWFSSAGTVILGSGLSTGEARGPLDGLRVADASVGIAGAYCTKLLADAGADVVKLEPLGGDPLARRGPLGVPLDPDSDGALFGFLHTSKRRVETGGGFDTVATAAAELAGRLDVIVVGPELDVSKLRDGHESLIVVRLSDFGADGPWATRPGGDLVLQALSSSISGRGEKAGRPMAAGGELIEWATGATAALAVTLALRQRHNHGRGDSIDLAKLEVAVNLFNGFRAIAGQMGPPPAPPLRVVEVPSIEPAADGWVGFCTLSAEQFAGFAALIERPEWATDPEIRRIDVRCERAAELRPQIGAWTTGHRVAEILELAASKRIPAAPVGNGATAPDIEQFAARGVFVPAPGATYRQPRVPYQASRSRPRSMAAPSRRGSSSLAQVLASWEQARAEAMADGAGALPLSGCRVFDFTSFWAGPAASQILGAFGAEVIKVESVQRPDGTRMATSYGMQGSQLWERAPLFQGVNTAKKDVTIDLTRPEGRSLAQRLLGHCDILIENYVPRVAENFGLLDECRDDLIVVRMPAWGLSGPWRDRPGFAQTMEQVSGLAWVTGDPEGPPLIPRGPCDPIGALHAAFATMAAVIERDRSGRGQLIEVPLVESALNVAAEQFLAYGAYGELLERRGNGHPRAAPHDVFRCAGAEEWVAIAVLDDDQWSRLRSALGEPAWAASPDYDTAAGRLRAGVELGQALGDWCRRQAAAAIEQRLWAAGVPAAVVVTPHEVVGLEQLRHRRFFEPVQHPVIGPLAIPAFPARFASRQVPFHLGPAPLLGQHNAEVFGGLIGLSAGELAQLTAEGIIGTEPV